jgi:hypothetical protein
MFRRIFWLAERGHRAGEGGGEGAVEFAFFEGHTAVVGDDVAGGNEELLLEGE